MTTSSTGKAGSKQYQGVGITVHTGGSIFEGMGGSLNHIDQIASNVELNRRWANALIGAFPGAAVRIVPLVGAGPTRAELSYPEGDGPDAPVGSARRPDTEAQVRRLLHDVYQRMDWFVETQPVSVLAPPPAHAEIANPNGIARPNTDRLAPSSRRR